LPVHWFLAKARRAPSSAVAAEVFPDRVGRKRGSVFGLLVAELMDELAEGVIGVAETSSGNLLGDAIDEDGAQGLVLTLPRAGWLQKEVAQRRVRHGQQPENVRE
jgi:hypothetical protein